jgi:hypothetical protein
MGALKGHSAKSARVFTFTVYRLKAGVINNSAKTMPFGAPRQGIMRGFPRIARRLTDAVGLAVFDTRHGDYTFLHTCHRSCITQATLCTHKTFKFMHHSHAFEWDQHGERMPAAGISAQP